MREAVTFVLAGLFSSALWLALVDEVAFHSAPAVAAHLDQLARTAIHSIASPPLTATCTFLTNLGSTPVLLLLASVLFLSLRHRLTRYQALLPLVAIACGELVMETTKAVIRRPRPHPWFGLPVPQSWSFPSGHAIDSTVCYLVFGALFLPLLHSRSWRVAMTLLAFALPLVIGLTRIYLGMHWPTDVLAGWIAGLFLAAGLVRSARAKPQRTAELMQRVID